MYNLRTHHQHSLGRVFAWMSLITALSVGFIRPIFPNFVKLFLTTDQAVSLFYAAMALMMLLAALASTIIFRKIPRTVITKFSLILTGAVLLSFTIVTRFTTLFILETVRIWLEIITLIAFGLFVRDFARSKNLGREEGFHYRFQNIGTFIGPLLGGFIATKLGYEFAFIAATIVSFFAFAYFYHQHVVQKHPAITDDHTKVHTAPPASIKKFFQSSQRFKAYLVTICFMLWVSFKRLYIPLYIVSAGYLESMTGLIIALSILPLIFLEVKVGLLGDRYGLKKILSTGFLLMSLLLLVVFFSPYNLLNFLLLALVNIGGALVEPLQEPLLFKDLSKAQEDELYGVYMTADPIAFFLTPLIGSIVLLLLPFKFLFLIFGLILLGMSIFARTKIEA